MFDGGSEPSRPVLLGFVYWLVQFAGEPMVPLPMVFVMMVPFWRFFMFLGNREVAATLWHPYMVVSFLLIQHVNGGIELLSAIVSQFGGSSYLLLSAMVSLWVAVQ